MVVGAGVGDYGYCDVCGERLTSRLELELHEKCHRAVQPWTDASLPLVVRANEACEALTGVPTPMVRLKALRRRRKASAEMKKADSSWESAVRRLERRADVAEDSQEEAVSIYFSEYVPAVEEFRAATIEAACIEGSVPTAELELQRKKMRKSKGKRAEKRVKKAEKRVKK